MSHSTTSSRFPSRLRRGFATAVAGAAVFALVGCAGGSGGGSDAGDGTAQLDVALWGDANRAEIYENALALFEEENEGIETKLQFADLNPYLERLATSAAAQDLPDVLFMRDTHIGRYGSAGSLLDLTPYLGDIISTDAIGDAGVADGTVEGGVYGLPTHYVGQAILFDQTKLDELGADADSIATWDDYAETALAASDPASGYYGSVDPTTGSTHRAFESWIRQAGEELFTEDGGIGFTAETAEGWFQYWADLRDAGALPPADVQIESESSGWASDLLTTGKAALRPSSTNHLTIVQGLTPNPIGLASTPANADATDDWWFFPPILISVAANTPDPEAAAKLVDFLVNSTEAAEITKLSQGAPSSSAVREAILPSLDEQETQFIEQISREQENERRPFPIRPEGAEAFNAAITRAGQEIAYGRQSVQEAVAALMAAAEQTLNQ